METEPDIPDNIKCPYCGAQNSVESDFCGACYKNLRVPAEVRAQAKTRRILAGRPDVFTAGVPEGGRPASRLWGRAALIAGLFLFYIQWFRKEKFFSFLDWVNLAFHEAGHIFLGLFGSFISTLGGTIFQLLMPALCLFHFRRKGANLGWQLCLFWIGENLLNISIYARDAINQDLPLVGGGVHDWTYLLTATGLIAHTEGVGRFIFIMGSMVIFCSLYLIGRDALNREPVNMGDLKLY